MKRDTITGANEAVQAKTSVRRIYPQPKPDVVPTPELFERFWSQVNFGPNCWEWKNATGEKYAYGRISVKQVRHKAHRVSFVLAFGSIPKDKLVCHHCDNPKCVRPDHLFVGTVGDNVQDMMDKGRAKYPRNLTRVRNVGRGRPFGERVGTALLSNQQVTEIKKLYKTRKFTQQQLGDMFGVKQVTISTITRGYAWKRIN